MSNETQDLEQIMQQMAAVDSAGSDLSMGDDINIEDMIPDMEEINEQVTNLETSVQDEDETDAITDYKKARNHLHWAVEANQQMIVNNARLAKVTTHPKNFEMHQKLMESHLKLCLAMVELSPKVDEAKIKSRITRSSKILPDETEDDVIEGELSKGQSVSLTRRPTQTSLFEAVNASRNIEKETGKALTNEQITKLAFEIQERNEGLEEGGENG